MDLSVVVPVYNEEKNVQNLIKEIQDIIKNLTLKSEIIFVDDGSSDNTASLLEHSIKQTPQLKVIQLRKNFGQTSALVAGFDHADGQIIISMDGDGQNNPADIPRLIEKIQEGYDIVSGWRKIRKDPFWSRRLPSQVANKIISWSTRVKLHDYGCSLKAFRREVIENINLYGEMHRFIPAVASWMGIRLAEIEVDHRPRRFGDSKYGISRTFRVILDLITIKFLLSFSTNPNRIFGFTGMMFLISGAIFFLVVAFEKMFMGISGNRPLLTISMMLILSGLQFICFGLLAELQIRSYHETTKKAIYAIKKISEKNTT